MPENAQKISALEDKLNEHQQRLDAGQATMHQLKDDLAANTAATQRIDASTIKIVEFFESAQGAFRVLDWLGRLAKPVGAIVALGVAVWSAVQAAGFGGGHK